MSSAAKYGTATKATMGSVIPLKRLLMLQRINTHFFYRVQGLCPVQGIHTSEGVASQE